MITRLEIDGFKSFRNFSVDLRPFQVFIGENGSGKSNLFDAITLLGRLSHLPIAEALRGGRGDVLDQFSSFEGEPSSQMSFAAELLLDPFLADDFERVLEPSATRVRYELSIEKRNENGLPRLVLTHEALYPLTSDEWATALIGGSDRPEWLRYGAQPFISTIPDSGGFVVHDEVTSTTRSLPPFSHGTRTLLSIAMSNSPTLYATKHALAAARLYSLDAEVMQGRRKIDSGYYTHTLHPDGSNIAEVLYFMQHRDAALLRNISLIMTRIVKRLKRIYVLYTPSDSIVEIRFEMQNGQDLPASVMSTGTLRALAMVTLSQDPLLEGIICIDEPENGIQVENVDLLYEAVWRAMASDLKTDPPQKPLSQVLLSTHSPAMIAAALPHELLYVYKPSTQTHTRMSGIDTAGPLNATHPGLGIALKQYLGRVLRTASPASAKMEPSS